MKRQLKGIVISDKQDKTRIVKIERQMLHPLYKKYMKRYTKLVIHDEKNNSKRGDSVLIEETRPLSRTKNWRLIEIIK